MPVGRTRQSGEQLDLTSPNLGHTVEENMRLRGRTPPGERRTAVKKQWEPKKLGHTGQQRNQQKQQRKKDPAGALGRQHQKLVAETCGAKHEQKNPSGRTNLEHGRSSRKIGLERRTGKVKPTGAGEAPRADWPRENQSIRSTEKPKPRSQIHGQKSHDVKLQHENRWRQQTLLEPTNETGKIALHNLDPNK
jgi:hypothetical protein